jgi:hypothetical protein
MPIFNGDDLPINCGSHVRVRLGGAHRLRARGAYTLGSGDLGQMESIAVSIRSVVSVV